MAGIAIGINASGGSPSYSAAQWREAAAIIGMYDGRAMGARQGVRPGAGNIVTLAGSTITVNPFVGIIDPGLSTPQGPYWVAIISAETPGPLTAADATNPRKDIVIGRVYDHDEDASGQRLMRSEYIAGIAAPAPNEPAVPPGAIRLATIDVPASPGAAVVTNNYRFEVAPGGILPVRTAVDITAGVEGRYRDRLDLDVLERDDGANWVTVADAQVFTDWVSVVAPTLTWSSTGTAPSLGNGALIARYKKVGRVVHFVIKLFWGSTTTGGTGAWSFGGLPATIDRAVSDTMLHATCYDSSATQPYPASAQLSSSGATTVSRIGGHSSTGAIGLVAAAHPFTWATNDVLYISGTYQSAS